MNLHHKGSKQNFHASVAALARNTGLIRSVLSHVLLFTIGFIAQFIRMQSSIPEQQYLLNVPKSECREYGDGWHAIEVFYGKTDQFEKVLPALDWFAQAKQDEIVNKLFRGKRDGFFIDLAANDATNLSNSYSLEKKLNWSGLCIEPNPVYWNGLSHRKCQAVAAVVGENKMDEISFMFSRSEYGGIVGEGFDNRDAAGAVVKYTTTLIEILQRFNVPANIEYLSLDVEGAEDFIMQKFPFDKYMISVMTVERPNENLKTLLKNNNFELIGIISTWGETLWVHKKMKGSLDVASIQEYLLLS